MFDTIIKYLKQPSTWKGLIGLLGAIGISLNPDQIAVIIPAIIGVVGVIEVFVDEDKKKS